MAIKVLKPGFRSTQSRDLGRPGLLFIISAPITRLSGGMERGGAKRKKTLVGEKRKGGSERSAY